MRPHTEAVMPRVPRSDPKITALSLLVSRCRPWGSSPPILPQLRPALSLLVSRCRPW